MGFGEVVLRILGAILALAFVLFLAWFCLRFLNRRIPGFGGGGGRMITVLDRVNLGKNNGLFLVRVEDKVFLIGMSEHAVSTIREFDDPEGKLTLPERPENIPFTEALKEAAAKLKDRSGKGGGEGGL